MDRLIYTSQNTLSNLYDNRSIRSQNLSNLSVPGYRRDLPVETVNTVFASMMDAHDVRAFAVRTDESVFSAEPAELTHTDDSMDIAIRGEGYFIVGGDNGPHLTRRGDLSVDNEGNLMNGSLDPILDADLNPVLLPPHRRLVVSENGELSIEPLNGPAGTLVPVATIAITSAEGARLKKFADGKIRLVDGGIPAADQQPKIVQSYLEQSNVNVVDELVTSIEEQRQYEISIKMIKNAQTIDEASTSLMKMPT